MRPEVDGGDAEIACVNLNRPENYCTYSKRYLYLIIKRLFLIITYFVFTLEEKYGGWESICFKEGGGKVTCVRELAFRGYRSDITDCTKYYNIAKLTPWLVVIAEINNTILMSYQFHITLVFCAITCIPPFEQSNGSFSNYLKDDMMWSCHHDTLLLKFNMP